MKISEMTEDQFRAHVRDHAPHLADAVAELDRTEARLASALRAYIRARGLDEQATVQQVQEVLDRQSDISAGAIIERHGLRAVERP